MADFRGPGGRDLKGNAEVRLDGGEVESEVGKGQQGQVSECCLVGSINYSVYIPSYYSYTS